MKLKLLASVAAAGLFAAGAASAEPNGWYGAIDAGYHMIDDINAESSTTGANWNYEVNNGWAAFARLGYRFNPNWRVELEGGYRSGDIGKVRAVSGTQGLCNLTPATGGCFSPEGDIESATLMANVIYDFGYEAWGIRPFVGLGAGVNRVNVDTIGGLRANRLGLHGHRRQLDQVRRSGDRGSGLGHRRPRQHRPDLPLSDGRRLVGFGHGRHGRGRYVSSAPGTATTTSRTP